MLANGNTSVIQETKDISIPVIVVLSQTCHHKQETFSADRGQRVSPGCTAEAAHHPVSHLSSRKLVVQSCCFVASTLGFVVTDVVHRQSSVPRAQVRRSRRGVCNLHPEAYPPVVFAFIFPLAGMGAAVSMFEDCFKGKRAAFGHKRRALVNLQDMGVDIYEPAGVSMFCCRTFFRGNAADVLMPTCLSLDGASASSQTSLQTGVQLQALRNAQHISSPT
jgi:hypothetical protein